MGELSSWGVGVQEPGQRRSRRNGKRTGTGATAKVGDVTVPLAR